MLNAGTIRRYLLGELSPEERSDIEDQYFAEADFFEQLVNVENDLFDGYARGKLSDSERQRFERYCRVSPDHSARVGFARAFAEIIESEGKKEATSTASQWGWFSSFVQLPRPHLTWGLAVATILVGVSVLSLQNHRLRRNLRDTQAQSIRMHEEEVVLRAQIAALAEKAREGSGNQLASLETQSDLPFRLVPGVTRGSQVDRELVLPHNGAWVSFEMVLGRDEFKTYKALLRNAEWKDVLQANALRSNSSNGDRVVLWRIPSGSIPPGDYVLLLMGETPGGRSEEVESYSFRTSRK
jgi:hypothetical protein